MWTYIYTDELYHYGVKGMKWGKRKARYTSPTSRSGGKTQSKQTEDTPKKKGLSKNTKRAIAIGAAAAGTALAAYGTYKASKYVKDLASTHAWERGKKYADEHFYSKVTSANTMRNAVLRDFGNVTLDNADKLSTKVGKSTVEAVRYLRHPERYMLDGSIINRW